MGKDETQKLQSSSSSSKGLVKNDHRNPSIHYKDASTSSSLSAAQKKIPNSRKSKKSIKIVPSSATTTASTKTRGKVNGIISSTKKNENEAIADDGENDT